MNSPIPAQDIDFSTGSSRGMTGRILANSGLMGGARAISSVLGIVTLIITARALDDLAAFGTVLFVHAYMLFFADIATFKSWQAIVRFGADHLSNKDARLLGRLFRFGFTLDALAAILAYGSAVGLFSVVVALSARFPGFGPEADGLPLATLQNYVTLYCLVLLLRQTHAGTGIFRLFDKFGVLALRTLIMPVLRFSGACLAWWMGWGVAGFLCVWFAASALSYIALPLLAIRELYKRRLLRPVWKARNVLIETDRGLWPFVVKTNIDSTLNAFRTHFPSLLVTAVFGPALFAIFRIAEEFAKILSKGTKLFDQVLYPELSRLVAEGRIRALQNVALKATLVIGGISLLLTLIVLVFGEPIIQLAFGEGFEKASGLAVFLLLSAALTGAAVPFYTVFYVLMRPGRAAWIRGGAIIAYLFAFFTLVSTAGIYAAGWAALAGAAFEIIIVTIWATLTMKRHKVPSM